MKNETKSMDFIMAEKVQHRLHRVRKEGLEYFYNQYLPLIHKLARSWSNNTHLEYDDIILSSTERMIISIDKFDLTRVKKVDTFSMYIQLRTHIQMYLKAESEKEKTKKRYIKKNFSETRLNSKKGIAQAFSKTLESQETDFLPSNKKVYSLEYYEGLQDLVTEFSKTLTKDEKLIFKQLQKGKTAADIRRETYNSSSIHYIVKKLKKGLQEQLENFATENDYGI